MELIIEQKLWRNAKLLAVLTIVYNVIEGCIATWFGFSDESLTLFGFGIDSFIEVISGIGIFYMVNRVQKHVHQRLPAERIALQITGVAFYLLVAGLTITAIYNIVIAHKPETTLWGVVISSISILVMIFMVYAKTKVGKALHSEAILADVECTRVCIYMSVVLLISSGIYEIFNIPYIDAAGTLLIAWFSFREGKECFEKANSDKYCGCNH